MNLIIFLVDCIKASTTEESVLIINEIATFEKNMTYNIVTDSKGEITIKAKGPKDRKWSPAMKFEGRKSLETLPLIDATVVNTHEQQCILAYVEELDGESLKPLSGSYKIIEYRKLDGESVTSGIIYTTKPRLVKDMTSTSDGNRHNKKGTQKKDFHVERLTYIFSIFLLFGIIISVWFF